MRLHLRNVMIMLSVFWALTAAAQHEGHSHAAQEIPSDAEFPEGMEVKRKNFRDFYSYEKVVTKELSKRTPKELKNHPEYGVLPWDAPCSDCFELLDERTATHRHFIKNGTDGKEFLIQESKGAMHFRNPMGQWQTIDHHLRPSDTEAIYEAPSQEVQTRLDTRLGWTALRLRDGSTISTRLDKVSAGPYLKEFWLADDEIRVGQDGMRMGPDEDGLSLFKTFKRGGIKTDWIMDDPGFIDDSVDFVYFEHSLEFDRHVLELTRPDGILLSEWSEVGFEFRRGGMKLGGMEELLVYDQASNSSRNTNDIAEMRLRVKTYPILGVEPQWSIQIRVKADWLRAVDRVYPVVIDPFLYGEATYDIADIGFNYDPVCFDLTDYCNAFLTVTVPGMTTLTGAWFDLIYESTLGGCVAGGTDCLMREAAFQILGPCSTSPAPGSFWSCLPPEGDSAGTCYGDSLDMFDLVSCLPPSCPSYDIDFELRTFHCSCTGPNCGMICHFVLNESWRIVIEGRTVTENPIESPNFPDFEICEGDTIALTPTANWGVPGYSYQWTPGGTIADTIFVAPTVTTSYTSVVFDQCNNTDTVSQNVIVNPAPNPELGPFEDCEPNVMLDAGTWAAYFWPHSGETTQTVTVDVAGLYTVLVTDALGCEGESQPIDAIINPPPVIDAFPDSIIIDEGALAELNVTSGSTGIVAYEWTPGGTLTCINCPDPLAFPSNDQVYYVVGTEFGCEGAPDSIKVIVNQIDLLIPNAFTPNGDGLNDIFHVVNPITYPFFEMTVFDRWGEIIFRSNDIRTGWDGTFQGQDQEVGAYIWTIRYRKGRIDGEEVVLNGTITLIR